MGFLRFQLGICALSFLFLFFNVIVCMGLDLGQNNVENEQFCFRPFGSVYSIIAYV